MPVFVPAVLILFFFASPGAYEAKLRDGLVALQKQDLPAALAALEAAARLEPQHPEAWLGLSQTYWRMGRQQQSLDAAGKAEAVAPNDPKTLHSLAYLYAEHGDFSKAAPREERFALLTNDAAARRNATGLWLKAKQPKRAIELIRSDESLDGQKLLASVYSASGQTAEAARSLRACIRLEPYEEGNYFELGQLYLRSGHFAEAVEALEEARKAFDKSPQIALALGVAYYGQRRFDAATGEFLRVIGFDPAIEQPYVFLGKMLDQTGERAAEVKQRFGEYAKANPESALACFLYGRSLSAERPEEAEKLLRRAVKLKEDWASAHFELGVLLSKRRSYEEAARELRRAVELDPKDPVPHYHLARVYDRLGQATQAQAERAEHERLNAAAKAGMQQQPPAIQ